MKENHAYKRFTAVIVALTAAMVSFAWIHSCFPASLSSQESEGILKIVYGAFQAFGLTLAQASYLIRKLAHFSEFFAIGALLMSCAYCFDRLKPRRYGFRVLLGGLLAALIDETIQLGVEGRAGMVTDIWIDFAGVCCGAALLLGCFTLHAKRKGWK